MVGVNLLFAYALSQFEVGTGLPDFKSPSVLIVGLLILIVGATLRLWSAFAFYRANIKVVYVKPQAQLVTSGPFALSRNPLYIGILLINLGSGLLFGTPGGVVTSVILFVLFDMWARLEEKQLTEKFGATYQEYMKCVPRWV